MVNITPQFGMKVHDIRGTILGEVLSTRGDLFYLKLRDGSLAWLPSDIIFTCDGERAVVTLQINAEALSRYEVRNPYFRGIAG